MSKRQSRREPAGCPPIDLRRVMADVKAAYEDFDSPRRQFARTKLCQGLPGELLADLEMICRFEDDTDINWEVSFRLIADLQPALLVELSMVGAYALICRADEDPLVQTIASKEDCRSQEELLVFQTLIRHQWLLISASDLNRQIELKLARAERVNLYRALFVPEDGES